MFDSAAVAQLVTTVASLLEIVGLTTQDLAALGSFATVIEIATELTILAGQIQGIVELIEARGDGWRARMMTVPCLARDWNTWLYDASGWGREGASEALWTATLLRRTIALLQTLLRITQAIESLIGGTTSGLQTMTALTSVTIVQLQQLHVMLAAHQQVLVGREIIELMRELSRQCIRANRYQNWGSFTEY